MKLNLVVDLVILPGLALLPKEMTSPEAVAMLLAIGLQESRFIHRRQIKGPARGFYQFEQNGGVAGVLGHNKTKEYIYDALYKLGYDRSIQTSYNALARDDTLATVYARLLLWASQSKLPGQAEVDIAWSQYISAWRPGKPHRETWNAFYTKAWDLQRGYDDYCNS